jgi:formylglycine-generating enzyme required for sulfatase activity
MYRFQALIIDKKPCMNPAADTNRDCFVDLEDMIIMASSWLVDGQPDPTLSGMTWITIKDAGLSLYKGFILDIGMYEITNSQYCQFLNNALASGDIYIESGVIYGANGLNDGTDFPGKSYFQTNNANFQSRILLSNGKFVPVTQDGYDMSNHSVTNVSWYGAAAFCNYYGFSLLTEFQWQSAADFDSSYTYGCGLEIDHFIANYNQSNPINLTILPYTTPVDYYARCGYGFCDLAGNVWEWTATIDGSTALTCGGSWLSSSSDCAISQLYCRSQCHRPHGYRL